MTEQSCILHHSTRSVTIKEDYIRLMDGDLVAAAVLGIIEDMANAAIAQGTASMHADYAEQIGCKGAVFVGTLHPFILSFTETVAGMATEEQVAKALSLIFGKGFTRSIQTSQWTIEYFLAVAKIQKALDEME